jgi:5-methylcytosine-specific restriction protein B
MYTWVPFFEELGQKLAAYETNQSQLVALLQQAGVKTGADQYTDGTTGPLQEMDPFTFLSLCTKYGKAKQLQILAALREPMGLQCPAPVDTDGVPTAAPLKAWLFRYAKNRDAGDVPLLWKFYHQALGGRIQEETFQQVLHLHGVAWPKLTQGLCCLLPKQYLPLNKQTRPYLVEHELDYSFGSFAEYANYQHTIQETLGQPLYQVSHEAYLANQIAVTEGRAEPIQEEDTSGNLEKATTLAEAPAYYCVGSYWGGNDQTARFVKEGIWENGYDKLFIDKVNEVPVGAAIVIKSAYVRKRHGAYVSAMKIKARGRVTANPKNGTLLEIDWEPDFQPFEMIGQGSYRLTIHELRRPEHIAVMFGLPEVVKPGEGGGVIPPDQPLPEVPYELNTILYGPPGTGKTYESIRIAAHIATGIEPTNHETAKATFDQLRGTQIEFVTFHQNYAYEDFVVGIKPSLKGGTLGFERNEGVFYRICQRARQNYLQAGEEGNQLRNYVLVVDEINRANLSRVLGELITLLEEDKRMGGDNALTVTLPLAKTTLAEGQAPLETLEVPPNLYVLGTMNTADKSIALLDVALRRRFAFIGLYPRYDLPELSDLARKVLERLNQQLLGLKKSADFLVGHALLLNLTDEQLALVLTRQVAPLLLEYYGGRVDLVKKALEQACVNTLLNVEEASYQLRVTYPAE